MTAFSERRVGNWLFEAYGMTMPLPTDLTQRVKQPVPNRSERRRAARAIQAEARTANDPWSSSGQRQRRERGSSPQRDSAHVSEALTGNGTPCDNPSSNPGHGAARVEVTS